MRLEWTSELETGVGVIDDDHRELIAVYNSLFQYYDTDPSGMMLDRAMANFKLRFSLHLLNEENFMIEIGYPDFDAHTREHELIIGLLDKVTDGDLDRDGACQKIAFLFLQWITAHLEGADHRLAAFARSRSVAATPVEGKATEVFLNH